MTGNKCTKEAVFTQIFVAQEKTNIQLGTVINKLNGNGMPGLIERADKANEYIIAQKEKDKIEGNTEEKFDRWSRKKLLIIAGVGYVVLQFILELIKDKILGGV